MSLRRVMVDGVRRTQPRNPAPSFLWTLRLFQTLTVTVSVRLRNLGRERMPLTFL